MPDTRTVRLDWRGEGLRFSGGVDQPDAPKLIIDGDGKAAPGPMSVLLLACASCSGVDVVEMLAKMRVKLRSLIIEATGVRRDEMPRRYVSIHYRYIVAGEGLERHHAERAVSLSLEKYCSAIASLAPDIALTHDVVIEK
ncbi:MAG: OsmC family protein [Gemmatimonadetes bacterium]|nr:OsmC family protein [Gemmatimonadota bacterium]